MKFAEYLPLARRTLKVLPFRQHMEHMGLGVVGEFGELCDAIKKFTIYGKGVDPKDMKTPMLVKDGGVLDKVNVAEEAGDVLWYEINYLPEYGFDAGIVAQGFAHGYGVARSPEDPYIESTDGETLIQLTRLVAEAASHLLEVPQDELSTRLSQFEARRHIALIASCVGVLCARFDIDIEQVLDRNIAKLAKRYGDKFSEYAALNRDTDAERKVLDGTEPMGKLIAEEEQRLLDGVKHHGN